MKLRRSVALGVTAVLGLVPLAACTSGGGGGGGSGATVTEPVVTGDLADHDWSTSPHITIDVFAVEANFMGIQPGFFGQVVRDKFNMDLNIIAPNVGGGDTLYNTRVAGGFLGDMIIASAGQIMDELVQGGLLQDISAFYPQMDYVRQYDVAVQHMNAGYDGIFGIPTQVSTLQPTEPSEGIDPTFGAFSRWDYYAELGYPDIQTLEDLLPVLEEMQNNHPVAENGARVYGLSLFSDWDGNMMVMARQPSSLYGYDEIGFVLAKADGTDYQSIIQPGSEYIRGLQFYYDANQMGILDPESTTQNWDTLFSKYTNGQVLLAWWPWLAQSAFNSLEKADQGIGFMMLPIDDQKIFSAGAEIYGRDVFVGVGHGAQDPERVAAFIDWLYSPEGIQANGAGAMSAAGPQGLSWDVVNGQPELTQFGLDVILGGLETPVPAEWGGGTWTAGVSALNTSFVLDSSIDPTTGYPYNLSMWPSVQALMVSPLQEDWSAHMGGATNTMEYLRNNNQLLVAPGCSFVSATEPSMIQAQRNQIRATIIELSWQSILAPNQAAFDALMEQMRTTAEGLGYNEVLAWDLEQAQAQQACREEAVAAIGG